MSEHPGLGEATDITPQDALEEQERPEPAASGDAGAMQEDGLGTGDGADPQPGGAG